MSFNILYHDEGGDIAANLFSIAVYVDSFAKQLGLNELQIDPQALASVVNALSRPDFPHADGVAKASPFKKAANFFVWFAIQKPIIDELPEQLIGKEMAGIPNHQNVIFAYHMAVDCLHGAELFKDDGSKFILKNRIKVSMHFFKDFVEAFSAPTHNTHFKTATLLFEQLAYKDNRGASYKEMV